MTRAATRSNVSRASGSAARGTLDPDGLNAAPAAGPNTAPAAGPDAPPAAEPHAAPAAGPDAPPAAEPNAAPAAGPDAPPATEARRKNTARYPKVRANGYLVLRDTVAELFFPEAMEKLAPPQAWQQQHEQPAQQGQQQGDAQPQAQPQHNGPANTNSGRDLPPDVGRQPVTVFVPLPGADAAGSSSDRMETTLARRVLRTKDKTPYFRYWLQLKKRFDVGTKVGISKDTGDVVVSKSQHEGEYVLNDREEARARRQREPRAGATVPVGNGNGNGDAAAPPVVATPEAHAVQPRAAAPNTADAQVDLQQLREAVRQKKLEVAVQEQALQVAEAAKGEALKLREQLVQAEERSRAAALAQAETHRAALMEAEDKVRVAEDKVRVTEDKLRVTEDKLRVAEDTEATLRAELEARTRRCAELEAEVAAHKAEKQASAEDRAEMQMLLERMAKRQRT